MRSFSACRGLESYQIHRLVQLLSESDKEVLCNDESENEVLSIDEVTKRIVHIE